MSIQPVRTYPSRRRLRARNTLTVARPPSAATNVCAPESEIDSLMRTIAAVNGVTETYLVDQSGEVIASAMGTVTHREREDAAVQLAQDALNLRTPPVAIHFEFNDHQSHIMPVSSQAVLIAFGEPNWNYGLLVREVRAAAEQALPLLAQRPQRSPLPTRSSEQAAMRTAKRMSNGARPRQPQANWKTPAAQAPVLSLSTYADVIRGIRAIK